MFKVIHTSLAATFALKFAGHAPLVLAGDWNFKPRDSCYELVSHYKATIIACAVSSILDWNIVKMTTGSLAKDHVDYPQVWDNLLCDRLMILITKHCFRKKNIKSRRIIGRPTSRLRSAPPIESSTASNQLIYTRTRLHYIYIIDVFLIWNFNFNFILLLLLFLSRRVASRRDRNGPILRKFATIQFSLTRSTTYSYRRIGRCVARSSCANRRY